MRKFISISAIVVCCAIYYFSNNARIIEKYTDFRERRTFLGSDKVGYGGLYGMCYISAYRIPFSYQIKPSADSTYKNINLYLISDSYLYYRVNERHFSHVDKLYKMKWFEVDTYLKQAALDTTKKNVLVYEMTERYARSLLEYFDGVANVLTFDSAYVESASVQAAEKPKTGSDFLQEHFFNPHINSNLELNLFDYKIFRPFKELKANLNFYLFNRVNEEVFVDTEKEQLYYKPTVSGEQKMNAFYPLDSHELNNMCTVINRLNDYYRAKGFDEIYLSVIPNPVTIIHPELGPYNQLIPELQQVDTLRMKIIDMYSLFKQYPSRYYAKSDSHWNSEGLQLWLDEFNKQLKQISGTQKGKHSKEILPL